MISSYRARLLIVALAASGALSVTTVAPAQSSDEHQHSEQTPQRAPGAGQGMAGMGQSMGNMGGMTGMMQGCPMMRGGAGTHDMMPQLPPGNEKLAMQMHADMMRAMADVMTKYAARLPDKK
jgi:hypothetical protein